MKMALKYLLTLGLLGTALKLPAATYTWTGAGFFGSQDFLWSNPYNWAELNAPQPGEQGVALVFPNSGAPRNTTNDVINLVISSIVFQGANYGIHGGANGITMTLLGPGNGGYAIADVANNCQFGAGTRLHFGSDGTIAVGAGNTLVIKSRLSGVYGFAKNGPGTLSLQPGVANTFFGTARVLNGMLDLNSPVLAISGSLYIGGGGAGTASTVRLLANDEIGDTSAVTVDQDAQLWLNGHNDTLGSLTVMDGGTVNTGLSNTPNSPGVLTLNGNVTNILTSSQYFGRISGKLHLGAFQRRFEVESALAVDADISDSPVLNPGFTKSGGGYLSLEGLGNSYTGPTYVQEGELLVRQGVVLGAVTGGTIVSPGATLYLTDDAIGQETLTLNGDGQTYSLRYYGTNSWAGPVTLNGDCVIGADSPAGTGDKLNLAGIVGGSGILRKVGWSELHLSGPGNNSFKGGLMAEEGLTYFEKNGADAVACPVIVGRMQDSFPNSQVVVAALNQIPLSSLVTIRNSGALSTMYNSTETLGDVVLEGGWLMGNGGLITLAGNITNRPSGGNVSSLYGDISLPPGEHVFQAEGLAALDVQAELQGTGGVRLSGPLGLTYFRQRNSYSGVTRVSEGRLFLIDKGQPGSSSSGTVIEGSGTLNLEASSVTNEVLNINSTGTNVWVVGTNLWNGPIVLNATTTIQGPGTSRLVVEGPISGPGGLVYGGNPSGTDGTLVLQGNSHNTYQGGTTVLEGSVYLNKNNAHAIPGNLVIARPEEGAPAAGVYCQHGAQLTPAADLINLNSRKLTVNPSGAFHCGGFDQTAVGLITRGGTIFCEGGVLNLQQNWHVLASSSSSLLNGKLRLSSLIDAYTHLVDSDAGATLNVAGDVSQGAYLAHLEKQGLGDLLLIGSNSFDGDFDVQNGRVSAFGPASFGTPNGRTAVSAGASLVVYSGGSAEPFTLAGPGFQNGGALVVHGTNTFNGPITLSADADVITPESEALAVFNGAVAGMGGLNKFGPGTLRLTGNGANSYQGATRVKLGALELGKASGVAIPASLEIGPDGGNALVRHLASAQISDKAPVNIGTNGQFRLLGFGETIGSLSGSGLVELLAGSLTTGNDNTSTVYQGRISGLGGTLSKAGTNAFVLQGNNTYTGGTFVKGGTLLIRGQQPDSAVTIQTGGRLGGDGTVGAISDLSGDVLPGLMSNMNPYGMLKCGGYTTHSPANRFAVEINGSTPGVNQDQLKVVGGVTLLGGALQVAMNCTGTISNEYMIVKNDGVGPVTGTFTGLAQDAVFMAGGVAFQINYKGGDGNDIVLIQRSLPGVGPKLGAIAKLSTGAMQIVGTGIPSQNYTVEATDALAAPVQWIPIGNAWADAQGQLSFTDPDATNHMVRFYRFLLP